MTLSIRTDTAHPGGGYALLEGPALNGVAAITIESGFSPGQYLGEDGKWSRIPFAFAVASNGPNALLLGPHIVDRVPTELLIEIRTDEGRPIGRLIWADVIPSRNTGNVTSTDSFQKRYRHIDKGPALNRAAFEISTQCQVSPEAPTEEIVSMASGAELAVVQQSGVINAASTFANASTLRGKRSHSPEKISSFGLLFTVLLLLLTVVTALSVFKPEILGNRWRDQPKVAVASPPDSSEGQQHAEAEERLEHVRPAGRQAAPTSSAEPESGAHEGPEPYSAPAPSEASKAEPAKVAETHAAPTLRPDPVSGSSEGPEPYSAPTPSDLPQITTKDNIGENYPANADLLFKTAIDIEVGLSGHVASRERAIRWYKKSAEAGNSRAMIRLGQLFKGVDDLQSCNYFKEAAKTNSQALYYLKRYFWGKNDCPT